MLFTKSVTVTSGSHGQERREKVDTGLKICVLSETDFAFSKELQALANIMDARRSNRDSSRLIAGAVVSRCEKIFRFASRHKSNQQPDGVQIIQLMRGNKIDDRQIAQFQNEFKAIEKQYVTESGKTFGDFVSVWISLIFVEFQLMFESHGFFLLKEDMFKIAICELTR